MVITDEPVCKYERGEGERGWSGHTSTISPVIHSEIPGSLMILLPWKMILLQQNKKGRESGEKCHTKDMMSMNPVNLTK